MSTIQTERAGSESGNMAASADLARAQCTCLKLRRITRRLTQRYDERLSPSGLRITQFSLLGWLLGAGALSISALADKCELDRTTLTRNLRPLIERGLVEMEDGPDARTRSISLTPSGGKALLAALPLWRDAQAETRHCLGEEGLDTLHRAVGESMTRLFGALP